LTLQPVYKLRRAQYGARHQSIPKRLQTPLAQRLFMVVSQCAADVRLALHARQTEHALDIDPSRHR
jgi:hypothetical protein